MSKNYRKKKFDKKKKNTYKIFFLILVGMTVGFAAINTTLQLIGTLNISRTTWNIHWENPTKVGGVTATQDVHLKSGDDTTVEYQVKLDNQGDYYEFTVDAKNDGTIDAMITNISNKIYENNVEVNPTYLESTITYADGKTIENNHLLAAGKKETYKVKVAYKTGLYADQLPDSEKTYNYRFTVTYMQADEATSKNRLITLPAGKNKNNLEVGDEICINGATTECFNFIRYDENNDIVMLAKYNLNVGRRAKGTATNRQDSEVRDYPYGTVNFSQDEYWVGHVGIGNEYDYKGEYSYPNYPVVFDPINYSTEPDLTTECDSQWKNCYDTPGYSVAYYVNEYKSLLEADGMNIKEARLLTLSEAIDSSIGCEYDIDTTSGTCPKSGRSSFIADTTYWLGNAGSDDWVWYIDSRGLIGMYSINFYLYGVRPVIVISKANI